MTRPTQEPLWAFRIRTAVLCRLLGHRVEEPWFFKAMLLLAEAHVGHKTSIEHVCTRCGGTIETLHGKAR
jgi:hypothetical protein